MEKNFDNEQLLKSSEDCYKFSKSVSYETLVAGTATTGREYKQIRRLFLSSANKPLTAVGTLTSLLCNSAKVVENLLQTLPIVRLIKIIILISVSSVGMVAESRAEVISCANGEYADGTACEKCGDNCNWSYDTASKKLIISAAQNTLEVRMNDYLCSGYKTCNETSVKYRPWEQYISEIESVVIGDNITNIGEDAFQNALNLKTVSGMKDVTVLGHTAFSYNDSLTSFTVPASVISVGVSMFHGNKNLTELIIPDSLADNGVTLADNMFGTSCFANYNRPDGCSTDTKIVCRGNVEKCKKALAKFDVNQNCALTYCIDSNMIVAANESQCTGSNYYWSGIECARRNIDGSINCADGYAEYKNKCWAELPFSKKRWTPAEANEWLHDGNDNFVVITFKK